MNFPKELRYTRDHEWAKGSGNQVTVGITDHAQSALGDIVFVETPKVGRALKKGETFGVVESIKAVSDLYSPLAGKVIEVNSALTGDPSLLNKDPYLQGWIIKIEVADPSTMDALMDHSAYGTYVAQLK